MPGSIPETTCAELCDNREVSDSQAPPETVPPETVPLETFLPEPFLPGTVDPQPTSDPITAAAVDLARWAAEKAAGGPVGDHLGANPESAVATTHLFAAAVAGYVGWHWAVTLDRAPGYDPTVAETVLLPGPSALLARPWVPWSERLQPGDLSPGDILPARPDDPRLVPAYAESDDDIAELAFELGLGRERVLSSEGRLDAADRWLAGVGGPDTPMARQAPAACGTCGFLVSLAGSLRAAFGVCANEVSETDGRVVSVEFGCGAHSEAGVDLVGHEHHLVELGEVYDDEEIEIVSRRAPLPDDRALAGAEPIDPLGESAAGVSAEAPLAGVSGDQGQAE
jgi:hypothetical protein